MGPAAFRMMGVIANLPKQAVRIGMIITIGPAVLADVGPARNHVKRMRNDAGGQERLAVRIEIQSPWISGSLRETVQLLRREVVTPDCRVHSNLADLCL